MNRHYGHSWKALYLIGLIAAVGLILEAELPISINAHHILLISWAFVIFGAMAFWVNVHQFQIERVERKTRIKSFTAEQWFNKNQAQFQQVWDNESETEVI